MARASQPLSPALSALSSALQAMRKDRRLTQSELGRRTSRTQAHISAIESGSHDPRASTLVAIAAALECEWVLVPKEHADRRA